MQRRQGLIGVAWYIVAALALVVVRGAAARDDPMRACVERGGTYYEDGHCEVGGDAAAKACRRQDGTYRRDGSCEVERDPVEDCKAAGGVMMQQGRCYGLAPR